jgi:hypothetical protein
MGAAHLAAVAIEQRTQSLLIAQSKLEEIKAYSVYHYDTPFSRASVSVRDSYLCNIEDDQHPELRTVSVAVGYDNDGDGVLSASEIQVELTTSIARRM